MKITCAWQLYGLSSRNGHQYPSITTTQDQSFEDNLCWTVLCVEPYRNCHLYPGSIICRLPALDSSVLSTIGTVTCIQDQSFVDYLCWTVLCVEPYRNCHLFPRSFEGLSWPWSYGSWIYNYLCNQCLSPLNRARCTTLCDKVCQWLATGQWFSPGPPVSSTNKTEILLIVALKIIKQTNKPRSIVWRLPVISADYLTCPLCPIVLLGKKTQTTLLTMIVLGKAEQSFQLIWNSWEKKYFK